MVVVGEGMCGVVYWYVVLLQLVMCRNYDCLGFVLFLWLGGGWCGGSEGVGVCQVGVECGCVWCVFC